MNESNKYTPLKILAASAEGRNYSNYEENDPDFGYGYNVLENGSHVAALAVGGDTKSTLHPNSSSQRAVDTALEIIAQKESHLAPSEDIWATTQWKSIFKQVLASIQASTFNQVLEHQTSTSSFTATFVVAFATKQWIAYGQVGNGEITIEETDGTVYNPVYLFLKIENAVKQARLQSKYQDYIGEKSHPFFTITESCCRGRFRQRAVFGFKLLSVNEPSGEQEANRLANAIKQWHENLLKSISTFSQDELQINLKYYAEGNKINCRVIFTVYAVDTEGLDQALSNVQHGINIFFSVSKIDNTQPYLFEEISDINYLKSANKIWGNYNYEEFYRNSVEIKPHHGIGFKAAENSTNDFSKTNVHALPPLYRDFSFDNELLRSLLNQDGDTEIDILVIPKNLNKDEIAIIRQAVNNHSLLDDQNFNEEEINLYTNYLQKFIDSNRGKFLVRVTLKHTRANLSQHLKTGVLNYFFGRKADADYQHRNPEEIRSFKTICNGRTSRLPYLYSVSDSIQPFRLPVPGINGLPGIRQQSHRFYMIPDNSPEKGISLGIKDKAQTEQEIKISQEGLAKHLYILGQTGTGKSTLLKTMISDCLTKNEGFTIIDPHGDLFEEVKKLIPSGKQDKLVVIDTTNPKGSAKFNPLAFDRDKPETKSFVINELIRIVGSLYDLKRVGGPIFELYMKNGLLLILDEGVQQLYDSEPDLEDFNKVFYKGEYRKKLLKKCYNTKVIDFFGNALKANRDMSFENFTPYITSKLTRLMDDYYISPIISAGDENINFREILDEKKILMIKMDKGLIGADNVNLLGQMVISRVVMAAMSRGNIEKKQRNPHYLFIDEFQNFIRGDVGSALSEVRKYGLSLILANQTMGQLDDAIVQAIMGNVGSKCFFRPGVNDYEKIRPYVEPEFQRKDVLKLPNFNCISRLMVNNVPSEPFVFQTKIVD